MTGVELRRGRMKAPRISHRGSLNGEPELSLACEALVPVEGVVVVETLGTW